MKRNLFLILFLALLLATTVSATQVTLGGEMGFGKEIAGVGAAITMGTQGILANDSSTIIRTLFTKVNFGPGNIDNVGAVLIHYWPLEKLWSGLKVGTRMSADYEIDDADIGLAAGVEAIKTIYGKDVTIYGHADVVKRQDINYFVFGVGVILFR